MLELMAMHLLVSMWSMAAAWVLTGLSIVAVVQIALLIRGMKRFPTEIDNEHVHVRHGRAGHVAVPLASIERAEDVAFAPELKGPGVFRASLIASPNLALHLARPVTIRRRHVDGITLRLDAPAVFLADLTTRVQNLHKAVTSRRSP